MYVIADLQLHSRFSRAVSPQMTIPNIALWARRKGIGLVATGDWTHPIWFREIERVLEELGNGLLRLRSGEVNKGVALEGSPFDSSRQGPDRAGADRDVSAKAMTGLEKTRPPAPQATSFAQDPLFLLATEVSSIYSQGGKLRRVHTLIWVPTLESARKISQEMTRRGCNLMSDGRPIVGLSCIHIAELVLSIEPRALIIPAHAWTPWFSVYGEKGGFENLDEAFGPYAKNIYAIETGLSSNPAMNWRIKELDNRSIVSFSDAHSGPKIGREATVFEVPDGQLSYDAIYQAIKGPSQKNGEWRMENGGIKNQKSKASLNSQFSILNSRIAYTIEFYPEEGKYHYSGHRACGIRWGPAETKTKGTTCPVCGKPLVQGVVQRVEALAGRSEADLQLSAISYSPRLSSGEAGQLSDNITIPMIASKAFPNRPPFAMLVPLQEIISEAIGSPVASPKVQGPYGTLTDALGGEFSVLLHSTMDEIAKIAGERVAQGIDKVRRGDLVIEPGYDGKFGVVNIWEETEAQQVDQREDQLNLFA